MNFQLLISVTGSVIFFLLFTLSLGFWGRMILKVCRIKENVSYGDPLPLVAAVSVLAVLSRYGYNAVQNFDFVYSVVFLLGLAGFIAEAIFFIASAVKSSQFKQYLLSISLSQYSSVVSGTIICAMFSGYLCLLWPSRTLVPWLSSNMDYYSWIALAESLRGGFDAVQFNISDLDKWVADGFGTSVLFALFSSAKAVPSYIAAPFFTVTIVSWIGICLYHLIRSIFNLPRTLSLILSISLIFSNFFNFISLFGMYGHLVSLFGLLTCYAVAFEADSFKNLKKFSVTLFFPILFLFVCYQAALFVYYSFILFMVFLLDYLSVESVSRNICIRFISSLKNSVVIVILPVLASCVIAPQMAVFAFNRVIYAANQTSSAFGLKLIDPVFFSGIPIYDNSLIDRTTDSSVIQYLVFAALLIILTMYVAGKNNIGFSRAYRQKIIALLLFFISCIIAYILGYYIVGSLYIIWKFSAYSLVPLSFIFSSLLFASLYRLARRKIFVFSIMSFVVALILLVMPVLAVKSPFYGNMGKATGNKSIFLIYALITEAIKDDADKSKIIFDMSRPDVNMMSALFTIPTHKLIYSTEKMYFFPGTYDYFALLDDKTVIYSDKLFKNMYKSYRIYTDDFSLFRYEYADLIEKGAIAYTGLHRFTDYARLSNITVKILPPKHMKGQDVSLQIEMPFENIEEFSICNHVDALYADGSPIEDSIYDGIFFKAKIPKIKQTEGNIEIILILPETARDKNFVELDTFRLLQCLFRFKGVTLEPYGSNLNKVSKDAAVQGVDAESADSL
jgi:hypothetical protein